MTIPQEIYDMIKFLEHIKRGWMKSVRWDFYDLNGWVGAISIEYWTDTDYTLYGHYKESDYHFHWLTKDQLLSKLEEFFDKIEGIKVCGQTASR